MDEHELASRQLLRNEGGTAAAELLLRIPDAARALGIGRTTFYKLIDDGDIRVVRIGRAVRVSPAELHAFVARCNGDVVR
jgi:excisionase family DNA binding protein